MIEKRKGIILDYDDAIADYCNGVIDYAKSHYGLKVISEPNSYNFEDTFGVNNLLVNNILYNFNNNSYQFGLLKPIDSFVKNAISDIRTKYPDVDLFVVTKCGNSKQTVALRKVNIANNFGDDTFEDVLFLNPLESKSVVFNKLKKTHNILCVVDDHIDNINDAIKCGIPTIIYEQKHNVKYKGTDPNYIFESSWDGIHKKLIELIENGV